MYGFPNIVVLRDPEITSILRQLDERQKQVLVQHAEESTKKLHTYIAIDRSRPQSSTPWQRTIVQDWGPTPRALDSGCFEELFLQSSAPVEASYADKRQ